ncbi:hypothetical protein ACLK19_23940 [Escherichia coli]
MRPRYEARNDFDVFAELSERWEEGYARLTEGKSQLQWLETFYNITRQRGASRRLNCRHLLSSGKPTS